MDIASLKKKRISDWIKPDKYKKEEP